MSFTEAHFENAVLELIQSLGYTYRYGPDITRDYRNPLYEDDLLFALQKINPNKPAAAINEAVTKLRNIDAGTLIQKNIIAADYLQNGIPVKYFDREERSDLIRLIDYQNPDNNIFTVINQWTVVDYAEKRPDIVIFVNGIPVIVIELKSPSREETDVSEAYR